MSPLLKTLLMIIVAATFSAVASYFYPWATTEVASSAVGEPLFKDYDPTQIRRISIQSYNKKSGKLETTKLRRKGDRWLLPDKNNFEVTNAQHIALVTNSMLQREVLEETSNKETDHSKFGVIDPALHQSTANKSALGTKIILEQRSGQSVANLIIGKPADGKMNEDGTRKVFVSIPGKPSVYMLNLNPFALTTQFAAWVEPNVFGFSNSVEFQQFFDKSNSSGATGTKGYRIQFDPTTVMQKDQSLKFQTLKQRNDDGRFEDVELANVKPPMAMPTGESTKSSITQIALMVRQMQQLFFIDVFSTPAAVAKAIKDTPESAAAADFQSLARFGFEFAEAKNDSLFFNANTGKLGVEFGNGLVITLFLGDSIANAENKSAQPARYGMLIARVDESLIEKPTKPDENDDAEQAEKDKKAYLLAVKERDDTLSSARVSATEFNRRHADWIYAIPEQAVSNLLPELEFKSAADSDSNGESE